MAALMAAARIDDLDTTFDDHPSLAASLEDFEDQERRSPLFDLPSQHSGFRSEQDGSELDDQSSTGTPWSPPGFHRSSTNTGGWFRHDPYGKYSLQPSISPARSRQTSPEYQDAQEGDPDLTIPANIPLPLGTDSPFRERSPEIEATDEEIFDKPETSTENPNNCNDLFSIPVGFI